MLFDSLAFEQYFAERDLKKGFKIYEAGAISLLSKNSALESRYHIGTEEGVLKKKASHVMAWKCTCGKAHCFHLAALMFQMQHGRLELQPKGPAEKSKASGGSALLRFQRHEKGGLALYSSKLRTTFACVAHTPVISSCEVETLVGRLRLRESELPVTRGSDDDFYFSLAVIKGLLPFYHRLDRSSWDEMERFMGERQAVLEKYFLKGLTPSRAQAWIETTQESLKNNRALYSPAFVFLLPRALLIPVDELQLKLFRDVLHKRKYQLKNNVPFDPVLISRHQVLIMQHHALFSGNVKLHAEAEYYIAHAELLFVAGKTRNAFSVLEQGVGCLDKGSIVYQDYLEFIIARARDKNMLDLEKKYLRESFIYGLFIRQEELSRFAALVGKQDFMEEMESLLRDIRAHDPYFFDKMSLLLSVTGKHDDLVRLIARQSEKFMLLHEVLMKKATRPDGKTTDLYLKHLLALLQKSENIAMHQKVIARALIFFELVEEDRRAVIFDELLARIGKNKPVYRLLANLLHPNLPA
jgi:hypothetical protein